MAKKRGSRDNGNGIEDRKYFMKFAEDVGEIKGKMKGVCSTLTKIEKHLGTQNGQIMNLVRESSDNSQWKTDHKEEHKNERNKLFAGSGGMGIIGSIILNAFLFIWRKFSGG